MPVPEKSAHKVQIGCAGWTIAKEHSSLFPAAGTHLQRYATMFDMVEINSTFYRLPKAETILKWKNEVPEHFRFAVKLSKEITHIGRLKALDKLPLFVERVQLLAEKLGPILIQLPPSLGFEEKLATQFFQAFRLCTEGDAVLEPRHQTWFTPAAFELLKTYHLALVAADPPHNTAGTVPGGWAGLQYYRLHGSPDMYYSKYDEAYLLDLAKKVKIASKDCPVWVVFDNTASGAAVGNGLFLKGLLDA